MGNGHSSPLECLFIHASLPGARESERAGLAGGRMAPASARLQVRTGWVCPGPSCAQLDVNSWPLPSSHKENVPRIVECPQGHIHPGSRSLLLGPEQGVRVKQPHITPPPHTALPRDPATAGLRSKPFPIYTEMWFPFSLSFSLSIQWNFPRGCITCDITTDSVQNRIGEYSCFSTKPDTGEIYKNVK